MTITVFHPVLAVPRSGSPPLPFDDGGFFYIKRRSDGAILGNGVDAYYTFETVEKAREYIRRELRHFADNQFEVRFMPKLVTH